MRSVEVIVPEKAEKKQSTRECGDTTYSVKSWKLLLCSYVPCKSANDRLHAEEPILFVRRNDYEHL